MELVHSGEQDKWSKPSGELMEYIFQLCRNDDWRSILRELNTNPAIATTSMIMDNHISTTVLHQAITSKGDTRVRSAVIQKILERTPHAAAIKNGYGSLPLHVIAQRNTKMDAPTKELLIKKLVLANKQALKEPGGVGKRTPLHIIFTDYISPGLTRMMIENGAEACYMRDKKGFLPAHVACSRHCSPEKLRMLLAVNPDALHDKTGDGHTLLSLATSTATKSHPNYALIDELNHQLAASSKHAASSFMVNKQSNLRNVPLPGTKEQFDSISTEIYGEHLVTAAGDSSDSFATANFGFASSPPYAEKYTMFGTPLTSDESLSMDSFESPLSLRRARKRKSLAPEDAAVSLLLHFSRNGSARVENMPPRVENLSHINFAEV